MVHRKISKDDLIEKAGYLFRTRGFAATSIAVIAEACELSKASIYHHISSKQELVTLVIKKIHHYFTQNIFSQAYLEGQSAKQRLRLFLQQLYDFFIEREGGCLIANLVAEMTDTYPEFHPLFQSFYDEWIKAFTHILSEKFSEKLAKEISQDLVAQFQGALLIKRLYKDKQPIERFVQQVIMLFESGESTPTGIPADLSSEINV